MNTHERSQQPRQAHQQTKLQPSAEPNFKAEQWEAITSWPLLALSLVFVGLSTLLLADPEVSLQTEVFAVMGILVLWVIFFADFAVRLVLSRGRWLYFKTHIFEAISLLFPILRAFLLVVYLWRLPQFRRSRQHQRLRFMLVAAAFGFVFVYVASTLVWLVEHSVPGATIVSFGDAIWWGFVTITTVGYGDYYPITVPGRIIAVGLMLGGIVIIGSVSATVISALNDQMTKGIEKRFDQGSKPNNLGSSDQPDQTEQASRQKN